MITSTESPNALQDKPVVHRGRCQWERQSRLHARVALRGEGGGGGNQRSDLPSLCLLDLELPHKDSLKQAMVQGAGAGSATRPHSTVWPT
jgi:hypothetical protein